jgi:hypothetical protein
MRKIQSMIIFSSRHSPPSSPLNSPVIIRAGITVQILIDENSLLSPLAELRWVDITRRERCAHTMSFNVILSSTAHVRSDLVPERSDRFAHSRSSCRFFLVMFRYAFQRIMCYFFPPQGQFLRHNVAQTGYCVVVLDRNLEGIRKLTTLLTTVHPAKTSRHFYYPEGHETSSQSLGSSAMRC